MKKHQWIYLIFVVLAVCITINWNFGLQQMSGGTEYQDAGYTVQSFHSDIVVNEDNSYDITETIQVYFKPLIEVGASHGIYRYIGTNPRTVREIDGKIKETYYNVSVSGFKEINEHTYLVEEDGDVIAMRIGDSFSLVNDETVTYKISYKYSIGDDRYDSFDDFYFNLVGDGWTTAINNVSFKITFPSSVNEEGMSTHFYGGKVGGSEAANVTLSTTADNIIEGTLNTPVKYGESFTIRTVLPNGYYQNVTEQSNTGNIIAIVLICVGIVMLIGFGAWGMSQLGITPVVNFYPPKDMDPFQVKSIFSALGVNSKDLAAMIVYWANKGYLKITQETERKPVITKVKDLPLQENRRLNEIFDNVVRLYEGGNLNKSDFATRRAIGASIQSEHIVLKANVGKRTTKKSGMMAFLAFALWIATLFVPLAMYWKTAGTLGNAIFSTVVILFSGVFMYALTSVAMHRVESDFTLKGKIIISIGLFFATLIMSNSIFFCLKDATIISPAIKYLVAISFPIMVLCVGKIPQYTESVKKDLGEIYGFANTLILMHEDKIKMLLKENPSYFYDVLPYTYVLGINKKFTKKFQNIALDPPDWAGNNGMFVSYLAISSICDDFSSAFGSIAMSNTRTSSGSSGGSFGGGGGFSGGGFGGGGGGRW